MKAYIPRELMTDEQKEAADQKYRDALARAIQAGTERNKKRSTNGQEGQDNS